MVVLVLVTFVFETEITKANTTKRNSPKIRTKRPKSFVLCLIVSLAFLFGLVMDLLMHLRSFSAAVFVGSLGFSSLP